MSEQAWFVQQFGFLSQHDRKIIMEVIRLQVLDMNQPVEKVYY
jgi:hypothetical protein